VLAAEPPDLRPFVELIWHSKGILDAPLERVLPSATTDIVANLGDPMRLVDGAGEERIVSTTVTGLLTRPIVLRHPHWHEAVGARLSPLGIRAVLGIPAAAVRDLVVTYRDAIGAATDELVETCLRVEGPRARLGAAVSWFRRRVARFSGDGDALVGWATARVVASRGRLTVAALQRESGFGATRFNQRFRDELGVTPKQLARLVRFRAALDGLRPERPLADLATDLGYADQAHMNRDFRELGATTPSEVLACRYPLGLTLATPE
jgi:AraC-like DNA-binding protein